MSFWVSGAVVGSAVIGGIASDRASGKASDAAEKGIDSSNALAAQARTDAINLFQQAKTSAQNGIGGALNFYKNNAQAKINPYIQGNVAAQQVLGQGATQANNAILGLPVDMSYANPKQLSSDYSGINSAALPTLGLTPFGADPAAVGNQAIGQGNASGIKTLGTTAAPITTPQAKTAALVKSAVRQSLLPKGLGGLL